MMLNNERVADEIYASIKKAVLCQDYKIGDAIEVQNLAAEFGVSSHIAEQALQLLCQRGLLNQVATDMYSVKETHSKEFYYSGRFQIMFLNMEYIIQKLKETNIPIVKKPLSMHVEAMKMGIKKHDYLAYIQASERFYIELCKQANMDILDKSLQTINKQLTAFDDIFGKKFLLMSSMCTAEATGLLLMALEDRAYDQAKSVVQQLYNYYISLLVD